MPATDTGKYQLTGLCNFCRVLACRPIRFLSVEVCPQNEPIILLHPEGVSHAPADLKRQQFKEATGYRLVTTDEVVSKGTCLSPQREVSWPPGVRVWNGGRGRNVLLVAVWWLAGNSLG